jgi:hypothetical protein
MNSLAMVIAFGSLFAFRDISFLSANGCTAIFAIPPSDSASDRRFANAIGSRFQLSLSWALAMVWISGFGFVGLSIECRRLFSGNESLIHGRRMCCGIQIERASNRLWPAKLGRSFKFRGGGSNRESSTHEWISIDSRVEFSKVDREMRREHEKRVRTPSRHATEAEFAVMSPLSACGGKMAAGIEYALNRNSRIVQNLPEPVEECGISGKEA